MLKHLERTGNKISRAKLQFCQKHVKYLAHVLTAKGRQLDQNRKQMVLAVPKLETKKHMMSFLVLCSYCRSWISDYSEVVAPLQSLTYETSMAISDKIAWTDEQKKAFYQLKQALAK